MTCMYLLRKVVCFSCLDLAIARRHPSHSWYHWEASSECRCTQVVSYCLYLLNNFVIENSFKA